MPKNLSLQGDRVQRDLWALALVLLAILLGLSFVPPGVIGGTGDRLFPTGNIVGTVGGVISGAAWRFFGVSAFLIPVLPAVWAVAVLGRIDRSATIRLTSLFAGVLVLVPTLVHALTNPFEGGAGSGWIGSGLGGPLLSALGWVGSAILISFLLSFLSVATIGWNPIRAAMRGSVRAYEGSRVAAGALGQVVGQIRTGELSTKGPLAWAKESVTLDARPAARSSAAAPIETGTLEDDDDTLTGEQHARSAPFGTSPSDDGATDDQVPAEPRRRQTTAAAVGAAAAPAPQRPSAEVARAALFDSGDATAADLPTTALLTPPPPRDEARNRQHLDGLGQVLIEKLATFKIDGRVVGTTSGPVVTQFEISPAPGVKVARIANLEADLALAMHAPSVRIVAPIPGKGAVGVEVPNPKPEMVFFREVLESPAFRQSKATLPLALGKDIAGRPYVADLARMPHLLIAGATGSGKSVCINTIITSLIYRHSPRSLRLLMVDPKMVELSVYNDLPHLRHPVVTDNSEAATVLKWAVLEMEWRYSLLSANNVRHLDDFNRRVDEGVMIRSPEPLGPEGDPERFVYKSGRLPYIVLVIDELADLMMTVQGEVEKPLALLAQKARAIGIHLILATQRPSVNVITGLIKANFPSRIAFRVASKVDSRTILDQNGADTLLGNGDMLFLPPGVSDPTRMQGAYLSTEETEGLMNWYREQARSRTEETQPDGIPEAEADILEIVRAREGSKDDGEDGMDNLDDVDKLFRDAAELCIQNQGGSTSLLQRRLRIGYGRAARIIDQLHNAGILGPADGSKSREVLVDFVELDRLFPDG